MALPRLLSVLLFANALGGVLSCGGGSDPSPPPPPPPCSWQTCSHQWRNDWGPGISTGQCVNQHRNAHHIYSTHHGSGSCPASSSCSPSTQYRTMCKYDSRRFFNHISSENVEIFQTKLFRGGQTFLLEITSSSKNFETKNF